MIILHRQISKLTVQIQSIMYIVADFSSVADLSPRKIFAIQISKIFACTFFIQQDGGLFDDCRGQLDDKALELG